MGTVWDENPSGAAMTPEEQQEYGRFRQLIKDPVAGPQLMKILNQPNTTMGQIAQAGQMMANAKTPSQQMGTGLGAAIGMGVNALRKPKTPLAPVPSTTVVGPPALTPNDEDPSDAMNPVEGVRKGGVIGRKRKFASGGDLEDIPRKPPKREVLHRRPIISTTIVIAKKPPGREESRREREKPEKKARGGAIAARKPAAVPPRRGPGNGGGGPPSPFRKGGHVQVPRGSGAAQRGKKFSGIY
jgi:hypothetical protein